MGTLHHRVILDTYTAETLRNMVAYVPCDRKIARYLDIPERVVRTARARLPMAKQRELAGRGR